VQAIAVKHSLLVVFVSEGDRMAKFYIHFRYLDKIDKDDEGIDLPSLAEAP
jgi:hypothetical protein